MKDFLHTMQLLAKIPGKRYFISIFIIGTALFGTFSTVIYRHYEEAQRLNGWTLYNYEVVRQSRRITMDLVDMETGVRGYLLTGRKVFLEPYSSSKITLAAQIKELRQLTKPDTTTQDDLDIWLKKIESYSTLLNQEVEDFTHKGKPSITQENLAQQKKQMDELRDLLESYIQKRLDSLKQEIRNGKEEQKDFIYILILGTVLATGAMLLATLVILGLIARTQRAGQQVAEAEDRFRLVMNGINDGVYDFNTQDQTIYYSPEFKAMLGYSDDEFPNLLESFNNVLHPDDTEATWDTFRRYEKRETDDYTNMFRLRHKDGSWRWILSRGVGFWDENGNMTRLIGTHMDITEQKKREEDLAQANSDLETFTYIASHDLRSPLVNLKGFAKELQLALDRMKPVIHAIKPGLPAEEEKILSESLEEDIPEALKFIEKSAERMDTLTTAILDLSRIGKREYHADPVNVQAVVNKCLGAQTYEINEKGAEVICNPLPVIVCDALALEQIFSNLLDNAVKYLDPARKGHIVISARETATDVIFSVEDNGRGILEADRQKVFEMFRRARNTDDVRGSGMGMSFVKATLRRIGGTIWCESTAGAGSIFYVRLPKQSMKGKNP